MRVENSQVDILNRPRINLHKPYKVLVILATFNGEKYLSQFLDSLRSQEEVLISLLISDDNSTDNTLNIAIDYSNRFENLWIIKGQSKGPCLNFMKTLSSDFTNQFEFIALADQDDIWLKNHLIDTLS